MRRAARGSGQAAEGLEQENLYLKWIVTAQALDLSIVKEVASGNFYARPSDAKPWGPPSPYSTYFNVGRLASFGPSIGTGPSWSLLGA